MKKVFIIFLTIVTLSLCMVPAVGVSAESSQIPVEGNWTNNPGDPNYPDPVQKDTGNGFIRSGNTQYRDFTGGIEGTFFIYEMVQIHNYGQDKEQGGGDDFRHFRLKGLSDPAVELWIAGELCVNVEISWQVHCDKLVKDSANILEGIVTIHGETADGGKVHGVLSIWKSLGIMSYSGEVHFTP